ncbi:MAG: META domain-containing protein [Pseudomonadota bacterium]
MMGGTVVPGSVQNGTRFFDGAGARLGLMVPLALLALSACARDESVARFVPPDTVWELRELDGAPWAHPATISFGTGGAVLGRGPCNSFTARQQVPYPWFELRAIAATKRACPALAAEAVYFAALQEVTLVEVSGPVLLLSNDAGRRLVFRAR